MFHCDNLRWASMDPLQWCTTLSPPNLDGAPLSPCRISTVHHALLVGSRRCTTLSSLDLDGAPRSLCRISTVHHAPLAGS